MSSISCIIKDMARRGGREKGKRGLSAKYQLEKFTTNLPKGLYLWLKDRTKDKAMSLALTELVNEAVYRRAVEFLKETGKEIDKDDLLLIVLYVKSEHFPVGFIAGKGGKVEYFPASSVHTLEEELSERFDRCRSVYVLLTSEAGISEWNRIGIKLCGKTPAVKIWKVPENCKSGTKCV